MLSLLELRVSVEPCGEDTGVRPPDPSVANKASFVSGTAAVSVVSCAPNGPEEGSAQGCSGVFNA